MVSLEEFIQNSAFEGKNLSASTLTDNVQADEEKKSVDRKDSFLMPAINFARRLSMKITGSRGNFGISVQLLILNIIVMCTFYTHVYMFTNILHRCKHYLFAQM